MDYSIVEGVSLSRNASTKVWVNLKKLGQGSYGVVHLALERSTNPNVDRLFAVKSCLFPHSLSLQKELHILEAFAGCPTVVQCEGDMLSVDPVQGELVYNLFLEYAPGGNFLDLMAKQYGGKVPERDVKVYARMLVQALRDIHQRGYVHCDLKPENILVYPKKELSGFFLKIADFGLARRDGEKLYWPNKDSGELNVPGTCVYMPHEAINAESIHASLDIWSLGCVVLEMVTGSPPYDHTSTNLELLLAFSTPTIPETMSATGKDFLRKCFARNPRERWTASMLLNHPFLRPDCTSVPPSTNPTVVRHSQLSAIHHSQGVQMLRV